MPDGIIIRNIIIIQRGGGQGERQPPSANSGISSVICCISVHFHFTRLGTEIFLRELTLSSTLNSNPKSSRFLDLQFFDELLSSHHKFYDKFLTKTMLIKFNYCRWVACRRLKVKEGSIVLNSLQLEQ